MDSNKQDTKVLTYEELRKRIEDSGRSYNLEVIDTAYEWANRAHNGQKRLSGEDYIAHPVAVADILLDLGLDTESLVAAILHDVVEDTKITLDQVKAEFGEDVALLVDGVTKLGKIKFSSMEERQSENLRKMLLAMSKDVRVMLIKLSDRLHNMRTADAWLEQKRRDKSLETMEVYAPIAHRLGISNIKEELEDRSLRYLDPVGYNEIVRLIGERSDALEFIQTIADGIAEPIEEMKIPGVTIKSRIKSIYGIYRKMYINNRNFDEIYDVYAVRIIMETIPDCYAALGVIHDLYHPLPNRFKDYISTPKPNLYQSLHTTLIGHQGIPFEVQIRTYEMDQLAEYGVAAHWKYKAGIQGKDKLEDRLAWVRQLLENQRESEDDGELLRDIKSELLPEEVFVFTPQGDVINLPSGANIIDFAYAIHTEVGNNMTGAKVNGRIMPIDHKVVTGEVIEIINTGQSHGPSRDWINKVKTGEARNKIRSWFKKERKEENIVEGKAALDKELRRNQISIPEKEYDAFMENIAHRQRLNNAEELYGSIGYGGTQIVRLMPKVKEEYTKLVKVNDPVETFNVPIAQNKSSEGVIVEGLDNCLVKFAKCCNPLPGDAIVGFITRGFGVSIHKQDCVNAHPAGETPRWLNAHWANSVQEMFISTLEITALNRDRLLVDVSSLFADMRIPVHNMSARTRSDGRAQMIVTIGVNNIEHLKSVMSRLRKVPNIINVIRL